MCDSIRCIVEIFKWVLEKILDLICEDLRVFYLQVALAIYMFSELDYLSSEREANVRFSTIGITLVFGYYSYGLLHFGSETLNNSE